MKQIPVINCLRGIAASMVAIYHFVYVTTGYITTEWIRNFFHYGSLGVQMFFVISGVVIPLSMIRSDYQIGNWGTFMLKRVARLEPPYLICLVLALVYFQMRAFLGGIDTTPSGKDLLLHIGYLVPFTGGQWAILTFWTLAVEFQYYLIISLLLPLVLSGSKWMRYIFYGVFLIAPFLLHNDALFPHWAPLFLIGLSYTFLITNIIKGQECLTVIILCAIASLLTISANYIMAGLVTIMIIHFFSNFQTRRLNFLGNISYSLYLLHPITGAALINILSHKLRGTYQKPFVILAGYILSVICSYLFYLVIERPSREWSKKIKYRKKERLAVAVEKA